MRLRSLFNLLRYLFALIGVLACVLSLYGVKLVLDQYQLTPHQFAVKLTQKAGLDAPWKTDFLRPAEKHPAYQFVGTVRDQLRPRVLFGGAAPVEILRQRYRQDDVYRKQVDGLAKARGVLPKTVAWTAGGQRGPGRAALRQLQGLSVQSVTAEGRYGNGLQLALAYDLLADLPGLEASDKQMISLKLRQFLRDALTVLDGDSASLWHGRMQLASSTWVAAVALGTENSTDQELVSRAQAHFHESLQSLELTEGWPEGYNYWINNRAYPFALACLAHLNGVDAPAFNQRVRAVLERVGLWMIHGVEPQGRFHLFADTGPRNDLKDETQRVVDLIYLATGNPVFAEYSRYLTALHGREAYYRGYRWALPLFRGLNDPTPSLEHPTLVGLDPYLSETELFGRGSFGQLFARSGWDDAATFISFRAGDSFTHHGHYQAGHFTLNKAGEPLAISSGTYGGWTAPHRLNYYLRTVSGNSLLVLKPDEKVDPNRFFEINVAAGGQRIVMPTGSAITSIGNWQENIGRGLHFEGGSISAYEDRSDQYVYAAANLTPAYNNTEYDENGDGSKVEEVRRRLVYLPEQDLLLISDRVTATDPAYTKKWLLHSFSKPQSDTEQVLVGEAQNGILESRESRYRISGEKSHLTLFPLLPENFLVRKVGGPDYRYYVETDGDDRDLDGLNMDVGAKEQPWFDGGLWRLEVQPAEARKTDHSLVALYPRLNTDPPVDAPQLIRGEGVEGLLSGAQAILFARTDGPAQHYGYRLPGAADQQLLFGAAKKRVYLLQAGDYQERVQSTSEGVLSFALDEVLVGTDIEIIVQ